MKILIFILIFFILGALLIIENNNLAMHKQENIKIFSELYVKWINNIYINFQSLTGEIVKKNWFSVSTQADTADNFNY